MTPRTTGLTLSPVASRGTTAWPAYRRTQLDEQIERAWALATAFVRRLARHNTGEENQGKPACRCERCRWLGTLFDDELGARPRREGVTLVNDLNFAESLSQQIEDRIAEAEGGIDELRRRVDQPRDQLRALEAAHAACMRRI